MPILAIKDIQRMALILTLYLSTVFSAAQADVVVSTDRLGHLTKENYTPTVSPEVLNEWKRDMFESDEVWVIKNQKTFFEGLRASGLSEELMSQISAVVKSSLSQAERFKVLPFYSVEDAQSFLFLPVELKQRLPRQVLAAAYETLLQEGRSPPFKRFESLEEAQEFFNEHGLVEELRATVLKRVFEVQGRFHFFYTRETWSLLNESLKMDFIRSQVSERFGRQGLQVHLSFTKYDDIAGIAARYAGERDPQVIERYLRQLLERSQNGKVSLPLASLLHPFIRKNLDQYSFCSGPNCFQSGLNVNMGNSYDPQRFFDMESEFMDFALRRYRFVHPKEALSPGDLFVYRDASGALAHVSTYIVDGLVYTKNGFSKFNPYLFQYRWQNELVYFPNGQYKLMVLRIPKNGEAVISSNGLRDFSGPEVYYARTAVTKSGAVRGRAQSSGGGIEQSVKTVVEKTCSDLLVSRPSGG